MRQLYIPFIAASIASHDPHYFTLRFLKRITEFLALNSTIHKVNFGDTELPVFIIYGLKFLLFPENELRVAFKVFVQAVIL